MYGRVMDTPVILCTDKYNTDSRIAARVAQTLKKEELSGNAYI